MTPTLKQNLSWVLLTGFLGGAAAWAITGTFHLGVAALIIGVHALIGLGMLRWSPKLAWKLVGALLLVSWRVYVWQQGYGLSFPLLFIYLLLPGIAPPRIPSTLRGLAAYGLLVLEVAFQYLPVWCLLALLTFPIAVREEETASNSHLYLAILIEIFLTVGYLIKGLIR